MDTYKAEAANDNYTKDELEYYYMLMMDQTMPIDNNIFLGDK